MAYSEQPEANWTITYLPGTHPLGNGAARNPETVRAGYIVTPEKMPGWTVLKSGQAERSRIVTMVRTDLVVSIDRAEDEAMPGPEMGFVLGEELPPDDGTEQEIEGLATGTGVCEPDCRAHSMHVAGPLGLHPMFPATASGPVTVTVGAPPIPFGCLCSYTTDMDGCPVRNGAVLACPADHTDIDAHAAARHPVPCPA